MSKKNLPSSKYQKTPNGTIDLTLDDSQPLTGVIDLTNDEPIQVGLRTRLRSARRRAGDESINNGRGDEADTLGSVLGHFATEVDERSIAESPDIVLLSEQPAAVVLPKKATKRQRKTSPMKSQSAPSSSQPANRNSVTGGFSCPICLDSRAMILEEKRHLASTTCGHVFCNQCIESAVKNFGTCPTCRKKLNKMSVHPLYL